MKWEPKGTYNVMSRTHKAWLMITAIGSVLMSEILEGLTALTVWIKDHRHSKNDKIAVLLVIIRDKGDCDKLNCNICPLWGKPKDKLALSDREKYYCDGSDKHHVRYTKAVLLLTKIAGEQEAKGLIMEELI
jgi:hypothetical protein